MNRFHKKKARLDFLLEQMKTTPMTRHHMADAINMSVKSACKYITELKMRNKIYIHKYERTTVGQYAVFYMTGNFPDAPRPQALTQEEYNKKYKLKVRQPVKKVYSKFTPRPDYAAAWMFNPINENYDL